MIAAFIAGNMNAISGGGTFVTYPILLLLGNTSIIANTTSTIALWPGILAGLTGYKKELHRVKGKIKLFIIPAIVGGLIGSFILTRTKSDMFELIAPVLIIFGALLLHYQIKINEFFTRLKFGKGKYGTIFVLLLVFVIATYGAYFGAGIGILLIGGLSLLGIKDLYENIALKNVLSLVINFVAVVYFLVSGLVHWKLVPLMALAAVLGGFSGSRLVHHINKETVKTYTVILGLLMAVVLLIVSLH